MRNDDVSREGAVVPAHARRRGLMMGVGLLAALGGAGLAWWRFLPRQETPGAVADFWSLRLETPLGQPFVVADLRGRPLLVNFWATWCPPCVEELPLLNTFHEQNAAKGWQVLGLAVDQASAVRNFMDRLPIHFPVAMAGSAGTALSRSLGNAAGGLPFSVVFGADGGILVRKIGKVSPGDLASWRDLK